MPSLHGANEGAPIDLHPQQIVVTAGGYHSAPQDVVTAVDVERIERAVGTRRGRTARGGNDVLATGRCAVCEDAECWAAIELPVLGFQPERGLAGIARTSAVDACFVVVLQAVLASWASAAVRRARRAVFVGIAGAVTARRASTAVHLAVAATVPGPAKTLTSSQALQPTSAIQTSLVPGRDAIRNGFLKPTPTMKSSSATPLFNRGLCAVATTVGPLTSKRSNEPSNDVGSPGVRMSWARSAPL